jgi:hypothetical protein
MIKHNNYLVKKLSLFGKGSMIAEDDASNMRNYSYSCRCYSQTGILLQIKTNDFHFRIKNHAETWNLIKKNSDNRDTNIAKSIEKSQVLIRKSELEVKKICK